MDDFRETRILEVTCFYRTVSCLRVRIQVLISVFDKTQNPKSWDCLTALSFPSDETMSESVRKIYSFELYDYCPTLSSERLFKIKFFSNF